jgi:hypothetical protein
MKTMTTERHDGVTWTAEGGGWVGLRQARPDLAGKSPVELLALAVALPGNSRFVASPAGDVVLLADACTQESDAPPEAVRERLERLVDTPPDQCVIPLTEEMVETALDASGLTWSRRDNGWAVRAGDWARELHVSLAPHGVRVEAVLVAWDEIAAAEAAALAEFLLAAQAGLRFARFELDAGCARIISRTDAEHLDADLGHSLLAVGTGCRLLARGAAALLVPEIARAFLEFRAQAAPRPGGAARP